MLTFADQCPQMYGVSEDGVRAVFAGERSFESLSSPPREDIVSMKREESLREITEAFADIPYPGDDRMIANPEHARECPECSAVASVFRGRNWRELTPEFVSSQGSDIGFLSPDAFRYFLPAYLVAGIDDFTIASVVLGVGYLTRPEPEDCDDRFMTFEERIQYFNERISGISKRQARAIVSFLEYIKLTERGR